MGSALYLSQLLQKTLLLLTRKDCVRMAITSAASAPPRQLHQITIQCWKILAIKKLAKSSATPAWHLPTWKRAENSDKNMADATTSQQPAKWSHYLCSCHCRTSTSTGLSQIMLQHLSSWVRVRTCVEKAVYRSLSVQSPSQRFVEKRSTAVPATEPVAVIPLACGRHPALPLVASDTRVWPGPAL